METLYTGFELKKARNKLRSLNRLDRAGYWHNTDFFGVTELTMRLLLVKGEVEMRKVKDSIQWRPIEAGQYFQI